VDADEDNPTPSQGPINHADNNGAEECPLHSANGDDRTAMDVDEDTSTSRHPRNPSANEHLPANGSVDSPDVKHSTDDEEDVCSYLDTDQRAKGKKKAPAASAPEDPASNAMNDDDNENCSPSPELEDLTTGKLSLTLGL
jgi:hypothetical protein